MIRCMSCGAETSNGLAWCDLCRSKASLIFEMLPIYLRNLARWRPGRAGSSVPGSREPQGPPVTAGDRVSRALDEVGNALTTWARLLEDARRITAPVRDDEAEQLTALCWWLNEHLTSIATLDWCGQLICSQRHDKGEGCDGLGHHEYRLRRLTQEVAPGWYAGLCRNCEAPTYVIPGLTWVTCEVCGATTYARDHIDIVLAEARGWIAPPMRLAEAIVALRDTEMSVTRLHKRISKWGERGQVEALRKLDTDGDEVGPKRFRLGDVLDLLEREGETRIGPELARSVV